MNEEVQNDEILYRRVLYDCQGYTIDGSRISVNSGAFLDRGHEPSVDRAKLCNNNPCHTQGDKRNGVIWLIAGEVRNIGLEHHDNQTQYLIDVVPDPLEDNFAHAQIVANPKITSKGVFRRLRRSLALLANQRDWLIYPEEIDTMNN